MSLGKKYTCFQCGTRFYDLNRPEPICPKCGADQRENPESDSREAVSPAKPKKISSPRRSKKPEPAPLEEVDDDVIENDELLPDADGTILDAIEDVVEDIDELDDETG